MNIVDILSSLNKIGLLAFLITLGILIYEISLLRNAAKIKKKPYVPKFQEGGFVAPAVQVISVKKSENHVQKNKIILGGLIFLLIFFGIITVIGYFNLRSTENNKKLSINIKAVTIPSLTPTRIPTPTEIAVTTIPDLSPTIIEPTITEAVSPTEAQALAEVTEASPSPTLIQQLPKTGYLYNALVLFTVSGLFILFAFLF